MREKRLDWELANEKEKARQENWNVEKELDW